MPLEKAFFPVDLSGSVQTKTDQKMVLPSELTELENGVFTKGSTVQKRNGYTKLARSISGSTSISTGDALTSFQNELLLFSNSNLYSYTSGRDEWVDKGATLSVNISSDGLVRNDYEQSQPDIAYGNGLYLLCWEDTQGGVRASVVDAVSGAVLQNNTSISSDGVLPRAIELNGTPAVVYIETAGTDSVRIRLLDPVNPTTFAAAKEIASNPATSGHQLDCVEYADNAAVCVYRNNASQIQLVYITQNGDAGTAINGYVGTTTIAVDPKDSLSIYSQVDSGGDYYVAYSTDAGSAGLVITRVRVDFVVLDTETVEAGSTIIPRVTMADNSDSNVIVFYEVSASNDYDRYIRSRVYDVEASGWEDGATTLLGSVALAGKAFYYNSKSYVYGVHATDLQSTYFLMDATGLVVAKLQSGTAGGVPADSTLPRSVFATTGIYKIPLQIKTRLVSRDNNIYSLKGLGLSTIDFTQASSFSGIELGENLHIAGGFISAYDSQNIVEHGFHLFPENISAVISAGGSLTADKSFQWRCVFVSTDAKGLIHSSAPSVAVSGLTTSSNKTCTLTIPTLRITRHPVVNIDVYRTVGEGTVFYKVGTVENDTTVNSVTFADTGAISDTDLLAKQILYTTGGVVGNVSPPATSVIGTFNNRLFAVSSENPKLLYYSKKRQARQPVEFSDVFSIVLNKAERVTGLIEMDEKLIIFEPQRIFYLTGDGPLDTGVQNNFSEPQLVTSDVGCSNPDSIVLTPMGIMFMSSKGIYLLERGMSTGYIGAPVEAYNSETISSAVVVQDHSQVRFTTEAGPALIYDFFYNKWSTWTNHNATGATVWNASNEYCYLRTSGGIVFRETSGNYKDVDASITLKVTTGWLKTAQIQGFQRVRRALLLGDYKSNHTLLARVGYDFRQYYNETHTFDFLTATGTTEYGDETPYGSEIYGAGSAGHADGVYQFRMSLKGPQKCEAIRFEFSDTVASDPGQSYSITNLMLEIGLKATAMKLPQFKSN